MKVVNNSFLNDLVQIHVKEKIRVFIPRLRSVLIYTSIDYSLEQESEFTTLDIAYAYHENDSSSILDKLNEYKIIFLRQKLSPKCRMVLDLFVVESYSHKEITAKLDIVVNISEANLLYDKARLRIPLSKLHPEKMEHYG